MTLLRTLAALALAFLVSALAFRLPVAASAELLWSGAFGDRFGVGRTLAKLTPLLFTSLGISLAWRAGAFNIGGEGQFVVGAVAAAGLARLTLSLPVLLLVSVLGGGAWAGIAALANRWRGVEIVIGTILLNFVGIELLGYLVSGPLRGLSGTPTTEQLPASAMLWRPDRQLDVHAGLFLALALVPLLAFGASRLRAGYLADLVGQAPRVARANRVHAGAVRGWALVLSGALCGLAGGVEYLGVTGQVGDSFAAGWGFLAIPVALIGGRSPWGVALAALGFAALLAGSEELGRFSPAGPVLVTVVQALALLFVLAFRHVGGRRWKS